MKWWTKPYVVVFFISLITWLSLVGLRSFGMLRTVELLSYDYLFSLRPDIEQPVPVVLIAETEADIQQYGYPLPDEVFANTLEKLVSANARVIGVDKYRDIPTPPGSEHLTKVLKENKNIIWILFIGDKNKARVNPPEVLKNSSQIAFNDIVSDSDGVSRRGLLFLDDQNGVTYYSLPLLLSLNYLENQKISPENDESGNLRLGKHTFFPLKPNTGSYVNLDSGGYQFLLSYPHLHTPIPTFSIGDVLAGNVPDSALRDKVVLIGAMASSLGDYVFLPDGTRRYGVELHAHIVSQLLNTTLHDYPLIHDSSEPLEYSWILLWCVLGSLASLYRGNVISLIFVRTTGIIVLFACALIAFHYGFWIPFLSPLIGWLASLIFGVFWLFSTESNERKQLLHLFEKHVSPQVASTLWEKRDEFFVTGGGGVKPDYLTATVLFTDLANFTTLSEGMEPLELMTWLNDYMNEMSNIIIAEGGMINKYIGDAIMAIFGVPVKKTDDAGIKADALSAVESALRMREKLQLLNQHWQAQGLPTIGMRIGIHTGILVAGTLGGQQRMEYTVIGDTVNVASRLESFDKTIVSEADPHCRILIGEPTWQLVHSNYETRPIGDCQLKGKHKILKIYDVLHRTT